MKTNLGGGFIDGLGNRFNPAKMIYMSDGSVGTPRNPNDLPLITGIFQDNNSTSVGWNIGTYGIAYTIEQYCVAEGNTAAPKMQIAYMAANQRIMVRYATGSWSDNWQETVKSVAGKTGAVTLTKSDVGLSAVANVLQFSESNRQIIKEDVLWSGSATSFTKTINANDVYKLTIQDGYGMNTAIFTLADLNNTVSKYVYFYQLEPSNGELEATRYTAQYNSSTGVWSSFSPKRTIAKATGSWGWYTSPGITFLRLSRLR